MRSHIAGLPRRLYTTLGYSHLITTHLVSQNRRRRMQPGPHAHYVSESDRYGTVGHGLCRLQKAIQSHSEGAFRASRTDRRDGDIGVAV